MIVHDEGGSVDGIIASARADVEALIPHGHGLRGTEYAFERRGGVVGQNRRPDPLRVTAAFERRTDGCFV